MHVHRGGIHRRQPRGDVVIAREERQPLRHLRTLGTARDLEDLAAVRARTRTPGASSRRTRSRYRGGTTWAWDSLPVIIMYAAGLVTLAAFLAVERRAVEPVLPLHLFKSPIFTLSNIASFMVSVMMFGAMIYLPVYAQGVLGVSATNSGLILMPMSVAMIGLSIIAGLVITRTGRYKLQTLVGILLMGAGFWMLIRFDYSATELDLTLAMVVFGIGLGMALQVYTLIVQNAAARRDLGVATASTQFFRKAG